ncbi:organic hydroperoxide resistance protein [Microbacterium sp. No. 7]|uniref:organic hydroperoxide resistance protein n=1 Tax=Microbacterium sp. No. 7 TaxID=1714373 RepID=UPI0006D0CC78|nr:organic hydroperoxide resistance protein [Microbacterium sp. No. 7]ALJ21830.1 organic hydroperoxide resistance protein [Microbacterium sp. No. 7]
MDAVFTAEALSTGEGRNGHVATGDGFLDAELRMPPELGGPGGALNPEALFAAGYAACYHNALLSVGRTAKKHLADSSVGARVSLVRKEEGGYTLAVVLEVVIPHLTHAEGVELAEAADRICPYSNAIRGNVEVTITVSDD